MGPRAPRGPVLHPSPGRGEGAPSEGLMLPTSFLVPPHNPGSWGLWEEGPVFLGAHRCQAPGWAVLDTGGLRGPLRAL